MIRLTVLCLMLVASSAFASEPEWWTKQKEDCGLASNTAYNTWVAQGMPCNRSSSSSPGSSGGGHGNGFSLEGAPAGVIARSAVWGGLMGALAGSLAMDANEQPQVNAGVAFGSGVMVLRAALAKGREWPRMTQTVACAAAGAGIGASVGFVQDGQIVKGSAKDLATESKVGPYAIGGAAAVVAVGFAFPREASRLVSPLNSFLHTDGRVSLLQRGNRVGMSVRW